MGICIEIYDPFVFLPNLCTYSPSNMFCWCNAVRCCELVFIPLVVNVTRPSVYWKTGSPVRGLMTDSVNLFPCILLAIGCQSNLPRSCSLEVEKFCIIRYSMSCKWWVGAITMQLPLAGCVRLLFTEATNSILDNAS